jgi:hypothetical protein
MKQRCCWELVDLGPELGWHGLTRPTAAEVAAAGGDALQALPKVRIRGRCSVVVLCTVPVAAADGC